jgi:hypothetical protein
MPWSIIIGPVIIALIYGFRSGRRIKTKKKLTRKDVLD